MKRFACLAALLLNSVIVLAQQFSSIPGQGRSMVVTTFGIVSTPQFLASRPELTSSKKAVTPLTPPSRPTPSWALFSPTSTA